ncbi:hypothetical protein COV17_02370 [Candidatus Woesearchaeota archaeon CG10_big_fil_rev_8_21_14_0_10_36_11]|nr:MAG: hypothetical protein COV17_02370 [Candidatus Woesearchaeota archaeon CG10_big_fil_rev_8_21_14_0_10_36_11]
MNQFNYSSALFDSLESKANTIIVAISIILAVALNSYFLEKIECFSIAINVVYYLGIFFIIFSFVLMLKLRRRKFKLIKIEDLKNEYINNPNKDFYKIIVGKYIPVIQENFRQYYNKDKELRFALLMMKIGGLILLITIFYIFVIINGN